MSPLTLDPTRPCQLDDGLLVRWLPRGSDPEARVPGLAATVDFCEEPSCRCPGVTLKAVRIDDLAVSVERADDGLRITWLPETLVPPPSEGPIELLLDLVDGRTFAAGGKPLPEAVAPYFAEPFPGWVLEHLWDRLRARWPDEAPDWREYAFDDWHPGELLRTGLILPDQRHDHYWVEGVDYRVDTLFCVEPDCACTEARLAVFRCSQGGRHQHEVGSAVVEPETLVPRDLESYGLSRERFLRIFREWRRRHDPARTRLLALREQTRERGLELHRLWADSPAARARFASTAPQRPVRVAPTPGRNDPCPCGSGKKYKKCCGK
jgi:hypothetical protein